MNDLFMTYVLYSTTLRKKSDESWHYDVRVLTFLSEFWRNAKDPKTRAEKLEVIHENIDFA